MIPVLRLKPVWKCCLFLNQGGVGMEMMQMPFIKEGQNYGNAAIMPMLLSLS